MEDSKSKEENPINLLCKKYFTPELCDGSVTETPAALKNKAFAELLSYGDKICCKKFRGKEDYLCMEIVKTIEACWNSWKKSPCSSSYSGYFYKALCNNLKKLCVQKEAEFKALPLDSPVVNGDDGSAILRDVVPDDRLANLDDKIENDSKLNKLFDDIEIYTRAVRADVRKSLCVMFTYRILHDAEFPDSGWIEEKHKKYDFINMELAEDYFAKQKVAKSENKKFKYTQKDVSKLFGIPEKTLSDRSRKIDSFFDLQKNNE
ncbi:hypothetical protein [uncultured Treponema sp.]|uniref:hypothetical protein n=1 Tax=uncultured Treponema sp. TaxID=162155 RepID=UPI0025D2CFF4|nr:hypothetical protein [uncultured Treponema sp.]